MSILSAIARNLLRQEMSNRAEKKKHCFAIRNHHVGIEIVGCGDWQDTHAPNFDLQLWTQRFGVYLSAYGYAMEQVRFKGGAQWLFSDQNDQLPRKRQNVKAAEEQKNGRTMKRSCSGPCIRRVIKTRHSCMISVW